MIQLQYLNSSNFQNRQTPKTAADRMKAGSNTRVMRWKQLPIPHKVTHSSCLLHEIYIKIYQDIGHGVETRPGKFSWYVLHMLKGVFSQSSDSISCYRQDAAPFDLFSSVVVKFTSCLFSAEHQRGIRPTEFTRLDFVRMKNGSCQ